MTCSGRVRPVSVYLFSVMEHPLSDFRFCPHCGSAAFEINNAFSKRCIDCGFVYYPDAAAATVAVITDAQGRLLCTRRDREPAKGTLDLPGGFVDPSESLTDGLVREVREETGGEVSDYTFLFSLPNTYLYSGHLVHTADAFFRCCLRSTEDVSAHDDAAALLWVPFNELDPAQFGLDSVRRGITRLIETGALSR